MSFEAAAADKGIPITTYGRNYMEPSTTPNIAYAAIPPNPAAG